MAADQGLIPELFAGGAADVAGNKSEYIIPTLATSSYMPLVLGMTLVATMMAIIVSTADSFLLVPATNLTRDVVQRFIAPDMSSRAIVLMSRGWVLLLGLIAYLLVDQFPTILTAAYTAYLVYGAAITPALLAAFLWKRATTAGAIASILTGTIVTLVWTFWMSEQAWFGDLHPVFARGNLSRRGVVHSGACRREPRHSSSRPLPLGAVFRRIGDGVASTGSIGHFKVVFSLHARLLQIHERNPCGLDIPDRFCVDRLFGRVFACPGGAMPVLRSHRPRRLFPKMSMTQHRSLPKPPAKKLHLLPKPAHLFLTSTMPTCTC